MNCPILRAGKVVKRLYLSFSVISSDISYTVLTWILPIEIFPFSLQKQHFSQHGCNTSSLLIPQPREQSKIYSAGEKGGLQTALPPFLSCWNQGSFSLVPPPSPLHREYLVLCSLDTAPFPPSPSLLPRSPILSPLVCGHRQKFMTGASLLYSPHKACWLERLCQRSRRKNTCRTLSEKPGEMGD